MSSELAFSASKFRDSVGSLLKGISESASELEKDGVIQRFEYTFEIMWKTLKIYLLEEGFECKSPKDCLKTAFKLGLIQDDDVFLRMLNDRNNSSHTYSKTDSELIYNSIKDEYAAKLEALAELILKQIK